MALAIGRGQVWQRRGVTLMARFADGAGTAMKSSQVSTGGIARNIFDLGSTSPRVAVHTTVLDTTSVMYSTLQTDAKWTKDATGYNFADVLGSTLIPSARDYRIEYAVTPTTGEPFSAVFLLHCQDLYST